MTSEELREVADVLDIFDRLTKGLYEPVARMDRIGAGHVDVTIRLTGKDGMVTPEEARRVLKFVSGDGMQASLRAFADELDMDNA